MDAGPETGNADLPRAPRTPASDPDPVDPPGPADLADPPGPAAVADPAPGLTDREVAERIAAGQVNRTPHATSRSLGEILKSNVLTLFNIVVIACFGVLFLLGQWRDAVFATAAISNLVIGIVQEFRAKRLLDRLAIVEAPLARVRRAGIVTEISREEVVLDDILIVQAGDQVTADATLLRADDLEVDESLLTGESEPVSKRAGMPLLSGSNIVAGNGEARVVHVGADAFAGRLAMRARRFSLVESDIRRGIDRVLKWVSIALLPVLLIVVNAEVHVVGGWERALETDAWRRSLAGALASVIAMIPLGLVLLTSIAFTVGAVRLARLNVLTQEIAAVEVLARVDVLCLDKTGTLTDNTIAFDEVRVIGPEPDGWREALGVFGADPHANATARCLADAFPAAPGLRPCGAVAFSSERKWSAVGFDPEGPAAGTWVLGSAAMILSGETDAAHAARTQASETAARGLRTVLLAHSPELLDETGGRSARLPGQLAPVALLTFRERIRPDAADTLSFFRRQGVEIKVLSGDSPETVTAVARQVGMDVTEGCDARELPENPEGFADAVGGRSVFGRVTPDQKREIVQALRAQGHVVAMTGDGVNDLPALRAADIGIAVGSAAAASKAASRLVLLDGRFDRLPQVVAEGRRAMANLERASVLFLSKTCWAITISLAFGLALWSFPLLPRQLFILDGPTIGIPAFFVALMASTRRYRPGYLKRSLWFAVPAGLTTALVAVAVTAFAVASGGHAAGDVRSATLLAMGMVGLWVLTTSLRPLTVRRVLIVVAMTAFFGMLFIQQQIAEFFAIGRPPPALLGVAVGAGTAGCVGIEVIARVHTHRFGADRDEAARMGRRSLS